MRPSTQRCSIFAFIELCGRDGIGMSPNQDQGRSHRIWSTGRIITIILIAVTAGWIRVSTTPGERATIVSITDGDTVRLKNHKGQELRVRLACIDAPESRTHHGKKATERLAELTPVGSIVRFKDLGSGGYGRRAGELYTGIWPVYTIANRALVGEGKAVVYPQYVSKCNKVAYWWDEKWARLWRLGVHADPHFCEPWLYRSGQCPTAKGGGFISWTEALIMNLWTK